MNRHTAREMNRQLQADNLKQTDHLSLVPEDKWPDNMRWGKFIPYRVWRSKRFVLQEFHEADGIVRLTINRSAIMNNGRWLDSITWDELQMLKREAGYGDKDAVEVLPPDADVVDVANMRHLWVLPYKLPFAWRHLGSVAVPSCTCSGGDSVMHCPVHGR